MEKGQLAACLCSNYTDSFKQHATAVCFKQDTLHALYVQLLWLGLQIVNVPPLAELRLGYGSNSVIHLHQQMGAAST